MTHDSKSMLTRRQFAGGVLGTIGAAGVAHQTEVRGDHIGSGLDRGAPGAQPEKKQVQRHSAPSQLKITDLRVATLGPTPHKSPLIRIDTNQGIVGWGEVRDGADKNYALMLKSRILGENPCDVDRLFRRIKQFGGHGRQGGGVSGVEMALWDLAGKAHGVPVYQMLGGKFRDRVRLYADTRESVPEGEPLFDQRGIPDGRVTGRRLKQRLDLGYTWLKVDFGIGLLRNIPNTLSQPLQRPEVSPPALLNSWSGTRITDKGIAVLTDYVAGIRSVIGHEIPLAADHFGPIEINSCIRLAQAMRPHNLAWMEDLVPWQFTALLRQISHAVDVPILTGEDIYLKEPFAALLQNSAVDMIHPDLASAGGILETKKIGDLAADHGVPVALHCSGTPIHFLASVHCAAALENFLCLEHHGIDVPWWESLVTGLPKPFINDGFAVVPEAPGLGIELNEEVARQHLAEPGYFEPTPQWNELKSWDRTWS